MSEAVYFIRSKGRITGPFAVDMLQKLARRGTITRVDEVSSDRVSWARAAEYEELFPASQVTAPPPPPPPPTIPVNPEPNYSTYEVETFTPRGSPIPVAMAEKTYYYQPAGKSPVGPVSMDVLKTLAENGVLGSSDLVWVTGESSGLNASQYPVLVKIFQGPNRRSNGFTTTRFPDDDEGDELSQIDVNRFNIKAFVQAWRRIYSITGFAAITLGILMLLNVHLPWLRIDNEVVGWWIAYRPQTPFDVAGTIWGLMIGLTLCALGIIITSALLKGQARAYVLLGIGGLGVINYIYSCIIGGYASVNLAFFSLFYLIPSAAVTIMSIARLYLLIRQSVVYKTFLGVASGVLVLFSLIMLIIVWPLFTYVAPLATLMLGLVFFMVAMATFLAAGVMGFISLKPRYSKGLTIATLTCAACGLGLLCLVVVVTIADLSWIGAVFGHMSGSFTDSVVTDHMLFIGILSRVMFMLLFFPLCIGLGIQELVYTLLGERIKTLVVTK